MSNAGTEAIEKFVDPNIVIKAYQEQVAKLSHELIMAQAYSFQIEGQVAQLIALLEQTAKERDEARNALPTLDESGEPPPLAIVADPDDDELDEAEPLLAE